MRLLKNFAMLVVLALAACGPEAHERALKKAPSQTRNLTSAEVSSLSVPRGPAMLSSIKAYREGAKEVKCDADWDEYCEDKFNIDVSSSETDMEACSISVDVINYVPGGESKPFGTTRDRKFIYANAEVSLKYDQSYSLNHIEMGAGTKGSGVFFDKAGGSYHIIFRWMTVRKDFTDSQRKGWGCTERRYASAPAKPEPGKPIACVCMKGGDATGMKDCLRGQGSHQCAARFGDAVRSSSCAASEAACVDEFKGGRCPFDLDKSYKIVAVQSPMCGG